MTRVAILWHMHQPFYEDLATREHILPWVRLHALKDYFGMVALLREFPDIKMTFNLVPSLLVQLEAFAAGRASDRHLELSLKPAAELTESDIDFILDNFFHAQRQRMIDIYPRYGELLARRGGSLPTEADKRSAARRFTTDDLLDLQVWHKLAWIDPSYLEGDSRVRHLVEKGSGYTEDDKAMLGRIELELLNRVIPEYRAAADRGQIEISTSPFYHPILPLLCDTNVYLRTHPDSPMPRERFVHPEDAREQMERAARCHERLFGRRTSGLWPSEGSVSDAMIPLATRAGFTWMATDELILARTLGVVLARDHHGQLEHPERLYTPYDVTAGSATIACVFRDHALSDLIGFSYAGWEAEAAAEDFVNRLSEAGRRYRERSGGEEALLPIILDGENAWEHFEGGGRPFLRALYRRLSQHPELRTVTMTEGCAGPRRQLTGIFPGSWIDANFYVWIGHADDRRAWSQLADARDTIEQASGETSIDPAALASAREEVLIAEGSDWFWWYGDDRSSSHDLDFDDLFRRHLRNVYQLLRKPVPDELFVSNISGLGTPPAQTAPTALLAPTLDGEETSYFEWLGAGALEVRDVGGAMHQTSRRGSILTLVQFGFAATRDRLCVRLDSDRPVADLLADGHSMTLKFLMPPGVRFVISSNAGQTEASFWVRGPSGAAWTKRGAAGADVAVGSVLELAIPLTALCASRLEQVAFFAAVSGADGSELESHPAHHPIEVRVPDDLFEAQHWSA
ncbi:MAG TPA: glycoside hydrolase family 57 protein [Vicinamibacterales bacterium]|nr:glycoside hydrolase family 57 protein [Vicinamibacterales bacterium]